MRAIGFYRCEISQKKKLLLFLKGAKQKRRLRARGG